MAAPQGDEHGNCTYIAPPGRGRGADGKSMVDLVCVSVECYMCVQRFQVSPLNPVVSPDHCGLRLQMSLPHVVAAQSPCRPRVVRPIGADQCQAYRRRLAAAEAEFADVLVGLRTGTMSVQQASDNITKVLAATCKQACVRHGKARCDGGAPWFDEECVPVRDAFRSAWTAYTSLRDVVGEARLQHSQVHQQAAQARRAWARLKQQKRRQWARAHQHDIIQGWFSGEQRQIWRMLKGDSRQACPLEDVEEWTQHFQSLLGQQPADLQLSAAQLQLKTQLYARYARAGGETAHALHADITDMEVEHAMMSMKSGKGRDAAGHTGELVRLAVVGVRGYAARPVEGVPFVADVPEEGTVAPSLVACIVYVLNNLPAEYPRSLATGRLVPVAKPMGDPLDMGGYRGICVSAILSQLQDYIMQHRATKYVEDNHMRAVVQCGFRKDHGTLDALFTMQHLISKAVHEKRPLFVCYVDFAKAFDMVRREEMVSRARQLGMEGKFLEALERWFNNTLLQVEVNGISGEPFPTHRGTKQGSRLSPLCFGLFVEQLQC